MDNSLNIYIYMSLKKTQNSNKYSIKKSNQKNWGQDLPKRTKKITIHFPQVLILKQSLQIL